MIQGIKEFYTPLELLNLYYSNGQCGGNRRNKLWQKMNSLLSWDNLLNHGYQWDLCPLLFFIISKALPKINNSILQQDQGKTCPKSISSKLQEYYQRSLIRNMILVDELKRIVLELKENNIEVATLKGGFLAENVYKDIACRPMGDLDILIKDKDKEKCYKILLNMGYENVVESAQIQMLHRSFCKKVRMMPVNIEIHHYLVKEVFIPKFNVENVFFDKNIPLEYNLIYLSCHGIRHGLYRFLWLCDLAEIIKNNKELINWDKAYKKSIDYNIQKQFLFTMHLTTILLLPTFSGMSNFSYKYLLPYISELLFIRIQKKILNHADEKRLRHLLSICMMKISDLKAFFQRYIQYRKM
ncbi:MAG: nucleotidyltransferase family protein [Candidatus Jettenia caeni]|nr:nucleotidyltransferase family protein [Candidatus Jettenia sp. AMX1]NUN24155.1 nucleotidyltransferase family protein [Candidatus Jettenia caeni]WKZ17291.1 MAG: nucleotidyltransferase family protein [Candidatus Jettenia caeni]